MTVRVSLLLLSYEPHRGGLTEILHKVDLPGNFYVWLVSPEATFLRSKFVWANWDVEELKALKEKILNEGLIDIDIKGLDWTGWDVSRMVNAARNL